jgi:branched-chain amino acid aminotransferase
MSVVWFNGAIVEGPLSLDPRDRGLLLGDGLFETILVLNKTALWRHMHLARMEGSANALGLAFDRARVDAAVDALLAVSTASRQALRVTLTRGAGPRGLAGNGGPSTLLASLEPLDPQSLFEPVTLARSLIRRSAASPAARHKTLSYIDNIAAAREAAARGAGDALMLNTDGAVACSTIANVFLLRDRMLITPARDQAILTGVMRQALLAAAHRLGFKSEERRVALEELHMADAVFLTNSLRIVRTVKSLDGKPLATGDLTPLIAALCDAARLQCGRDPRLI